MTNSVLSSKKNFLFYGILILLFFSACMSEPPINKSNTEFIYIDHQVFKLKQDTFFPIMLNYVVDFRDFNHKTCISACKAYEKPDNYEYQTKEASLQQLEAHFQLIKKMGFNTLRICFDRMVCDSNNHYYFPTDHESLYIKDDYKKIITALNECIQIASKADLRVMLLIKPPIQNEELEHFTIRLLKNFKSNPYLFAYDFMNEPLYFDNEPKRTKKEAIKIVNQWKKLMNKYAPFQLFTIGFSEPIEVFEWDPSILPVDFVQIHTYHPLRVPNEIYWYSKYIHKPWMVGETALPADNDSISYDIQRQFMIDAFHYTVDCGGCGFGWWEFQEVKNAHFEAQFTGLLNHDSITMCGNYQIIGTLKPAAYEINTLKKYKKNLPHQATNYYNMMMYSNLCLSGKIINKSTNQPVEGAVIRGWNDNWSIGMNTFTNKDGIFTLYSNDVCTHFEISAPGMTKLKFNKKINYTNVNSQLNNFSDLPHKELEYQEISFYPFLKDTSLKHTKAPYPIFDFKTQHYTNLIFKGYMGVLILEPIIIDL